MPMQSINWGRPAAGTSMTGIRRPCPGSGSGWINSCRAPWRCLPCRLFCFGAGWGCSLPLPFPGSINKILFLSTGFYPPLFMLLSAVVKDVLMTAALLFGCALILWAGRKKSLTLFFPGVVFLTFVMLTRHNAILIALPMFLYAGFVLIDLTNRKAGNLVPVRKGIITGVLFFAAAFLLGNLWSGSITRIRSYPGPADHGA